MHSVAILGFFTLVVLFFFTGRKDFGLKPSNKDSINDAVNKIDDVKELEEIKN